MTKRDRSERRVSDIPFEGETTAEGIRRGEWQQRMLLRTLARGGVLGAMIGGGVGLVLGVLPPLLGAGTVVPGPAVVVATAAAAVFAVSGLVLGAGVVLARWDGAEQREINENLGGRLRRGDGPTEPIRTRPPADS